MRISFSILFFCFFSGVLAQGIDDDIDIEKEMELMKKREIELTDFVKKYDESKCTNITEGQYCVVLDATKSIDEINPNLLYYWDFGKGDKQEGMVVKKCYKDNGFKTVHLTTFDTITKVDNQMDSLVQLYFYPRWDFGFEGEGYLYEGLKFYVHHYSNEETKNLIFWNFHDDRYQVGNKVIHGFHEPGDYRITMYVVDEKEENYEIKTCLYQDINIKPIE